MTTREELKSAVDAARASLAAALAARDAFDSAPENNRYENMKDASSKIEDKLRDQARADCEGSYNCGNDEYTQDFYVGEKLYRGTLTCEYDRHDKTYYYLERAEFTVEEV
jgi:hypothetical protein